MQRYLTHNRPKLTRSLAYPFQIANTCVAIKFVAAADDDDDDYDDVGPISILLSAILLL